MAGLPGVFLGALGKHPRCSLALAGLSGTPHAVGSEPQGEMEGAASVSLRRGWAGGSGGWCCRKVAMRWGRGNVGTGAGSRKNAGVHVCVHVCAHWAADRWARTAPFPSLRMSRGPAMEVGWIYPPWNAARGKGA